MQQFFRTQWDKRGLWAWLWSPLSLLVCLYARLKRLFYQRGILRASQIDATVIVVGNLSVGGAGKTPLVAHIVQLLVEQGYKPGIISRGYRGKAEQWPQAVTATCDPQQVGDESVLLALLTGCPVVAGPDRIASAKQLITDHDCNVVLSDDGFQHLRLARDIDILVLDGALTNGLGNGWCLPSGPLREPAGALESTDIKVWHELKGAAPDSEHFSMRLIPAQIYSLKDKSPADVRLFEQPLHAIAGIGSPERFFNTLKQLGLSIQEHAFADHHPYTAEDIQFDDHYDLITTEKDAIKLTTLDTPRTIWVLPVRADPGHSFDATLLSKLEKLADP